MAGISIGCAAVIVALSIGESAQSYAEREVNRNFKMDEITVTPYASIPSQGGGGGVGASQTSDKFDPGRLTRQKLELIKGIKHVTVAAPFQDFGNIQMSTLDNKVSDVQVIGTDLRLLMKYDNTFKQGGPSDLNGMVVLNYGATVGLIDAETRKKLSKQVESDPYNTELLEKYNRLNTLPSEIYQQQIQLQSRLNDSTSQLPQTYVSSPFRVVGILDKKGSAEIAAYGKKVYLSLENAERLAKELHLNNGTVGQEGVYNSVIVKVDSIDNIEQVEQLIKKLTLSTSTNLDQKEQIAETFDMIKNAALGIGVFILILASISIIVAMTMSTHQRRRQIGIMKVLGANMRQIRNMFITEAALLGFMGGILGVLFSYLIVLGINQLIGSALGMGEPLIIDIPFMTISVGISFAVLTGVLSGIYPAISASRTNALSAIKKD